MSSRDFIDRHHSNTVAIAVDEFGNNSEVNIREMLEEYSNAVLMKTMKQIEHMNHIAHAQKYASEIITDIKYKLN